jgi:hypothetical protein
MAKMQVGDYDGPTRATSIYAAKSPMKTETATVKPSVTPPVGSSENPIQQAKEPADYGKIVAAEQAAQPSQ